MAERTLKTHTDLVELMKSKIALASSGSITDFSTGSDLMNIIESVAHVLMYQQLELEKAYENINILTAKNDYLRSRIRDHKMEAKDEVFASSTKQIFLRNTPASSDFYIYAGSQVSTEADAFNNTVDYTTVEDILFPSGAVSVTGEIICTVGGRVGNVPSGAITNITSTIPGVDSTYNDEDLVNGAEAETDEEIKRRLPVHINGLKAGNEDAIRAAVLAIPGVTIADIRENTPVDGENTVYVSTQSGILTDEQIDAIKKAAEKEAAFGLKVNISTPTVENITIELTVEYDEDNYTEALIEQSIKDAIFNFVSINPTAKLKRWDLWNIIRQIPGITNVDDLLIDGVEEDRNVDGFKVIRLPSKAAITVNFV